MLMLTLPYPPSVNSYWGFKGSHRFLTQEAKTFKQEVWVAAFNSKHAGFKDARLSIMVNLYPPDKRVRDLDNVLKPLNDALTQAKLFDDDGQIDSLTIMRGHVVKGGLCTVIINKIEKVLD